MRERIERAFAVWGAFAFRRAWIVIAVVALGAGTLLTQLRTIKIDTSTEGFLEENDPARITYDAFRNQFGRDERIVIAIRPPDVFALEFLEKLRDLHRDIENEVPRIQEVQSLINARRTVGVGDELIVGELLEDWPETPEQLAAVREFALAQPLYQNLLLSEDGTLTTITIETDAYSSLGEESVDDVLDSFDDVDPSVTGPRKFLTTAENHEIIAAVQEVVSRYEGPGFEVWIAGTPAMTDHFQTMVSRNMAIFSLLAVLTIAVFLGLLFRRVAGVVLPLVISILSLLCTIAIMAIFDVPVSLPTQILPSFLLSVGVGNTVHVLVIFFQARQRGLSKGDAISFALGHSGLAIVMTAATTAGGLLSFLSAELALIADFGMAAPVGVGLALLFTIVLLPALVGVFPMRSRVREETALERRSQALLVACGAFATRNAGAVVAVSAALVAVGLVGASQIRFAHNPVIWFPEDDPFRTATELLNEELKGTNVLEVLIDTGEENGLHDPELLSRIDELNRFALKIRTGPVYVGKTISLADVVKETHQALNGNRPEFYAIPQERQLVAQELLLFENSGSDDLEELVDSQFSMGRFTMKLPFVDAIHYPPFYDQIQQGFSEILGDDVEITITGLMAIVGRTFSAVIYSMASTYMVAFMVITPLMILLIGSLRTGLLSMIPNLAPIILTLGLMGWLDFPLNAFTLLIGSIAIGLAVDDTIHFMHNFRRYYQNSGDVSEAVRETLTSTGQALLFTSIVLASGFFIFTFSSMQNLFDFGVLTGFAIVSAFIADVVLAPALLALVYRQKADPVARAIESPEGI